MRSRSMVLRGVFGLSSALFASHREWGRLNLYLRWRLARFDNGQRSSCLYRRITRGIVLAAKNERRLYLNMHCIGLLWR